jgi:hypothetical protein
MHMHMHVHAHAHVHARACTCHVHVMCMSCACDTGGGRGRCGARRLIGVGQEGRGGISAVLAAERGAHVRDRHSLWTALYE